MKSYWKLLGVWVTGLKRRLFLGAQIKLAGLYFLAAVVILGTFAVILGYLEIYYLQRGLADVFDSPADSHQVIQGIYADLQVAKAILISFVIILMSLLSYWLVNRTLKPIQAFVESQRRFISDASHELRTPLATIKAENEVALLDPKSLTQEEAISIIRSNLEEVDSIATILNNLLGLASFHSATGAPPPSSVDVATVAKRIIGRLKIMADRKGIKLYAPHLSKVVVWANATALEEVVSNLLKNAIQYTHAGGEIVLRIRPLVRENQAELVIQDTGVGIDPEDIDYIFEPFYRSDKSSHMYSHGTGLGLPLVREIVRRQGGFIDIQSEVDKGTVVVVRIPLAPSQEDSLKTDSATEGQVSR